MNRQEELEGMSKFNIKDHKWEDGDITNARGNKEYLKLSIPHIDNPHFYVYLSKKDFLAISKHFILIEGK